LITKITAMKQVYWIFVT